MAGKPRQPSKSGVGSDMPIHLLRNLGLRMEYYLAEVGINSEGDLRRENIYTVYLSLKAKFPRVMNRMALYALYGALHDEDCMHLSGDVKARINEELEKYKKK